MPEQATQAKPTQTKAKLGNFGNGRYSPVMGELYSDCQRLLGFSKPQAHVVASRLGIDLGKLAPTIKRVGYGASVNKEGLRTVREVADSVKVHESFAITCAVLCAGLQKLVNQGLIVHDCSVKEHVLEMVNATAKTIEFETE